MNKQHGLLISIEGIDGCGKSTLAKGLYQSLSEQYFDILLTKEPGDTPLGTHIRTLVQQQQVAMCPKAEYLLFATDRAQHFDELVIPALKQGKIVISDRMGDSSIVYQGIARGLDVDIIKQINTWAMCNYKPNVTLFIKLDPTIAHRRLKQRNNQLSAFEKEHELFMRKVHEGFCALYKNRQDVILIAGDLNEQTMVQQAISALTPWLLMYESGKASSSTTLARQP